jgi:hypothetical protein
MQRYTIFFIVVSAVHVSSGFSAHHLELKNCTRSIGYLSKLFVATASIDSPMLAVAPNMYSTDSSKEYFITLHLVGCA